MFRVLGGSFDGLLENWDFMEVVIVSLFLYVFVYMPSWRESPD